MVMKLIGFCVVDCSLHDAILFLKTSMMKASENMPLMTLGSEVAGSLKYCGTSSGNFIHIAFLVDKVDESSAEVSFVNEMANLIDISLKFCGPNRRKTSVKVIILLVGFTAVKSESNASGEMVYTDSEKVAM